MKCKFCDILKREPDKIIKAYKYCYVIFADPRLLPGHILIIPKRHMGKLSELKQSEKKEIFDVMIIYQEKILKHAPGTLIKNNFLPFVKENRFKVNHLHIQIIPRGLMDEYYTRVISHQVDLYKRVSDQERYEWIKKLK